MQDEIFGPILPVLTYKAYEDIYNFLQGKDKPLALYIFSTNKKHIEEITNRVYMVEAVLTIPSFI